MWKAGACMNWSRPLIWSLESISIIAPTVVAISLLVGVVFYSFANNWDFPLAYYFAASVLFGDMYLIPTESNPWSHVFTLFYFLWGTTLLAGALAAAANFLIRSAMRIAAEERQKYFEKSAAGRRQSPKLTVGDEVSASYLAHFLAIFNWSGNRSKYLAVVCAFGWLFVGIVYGLCYEGWSFSHALLFSLAAMSTAGNISPVCEGDVNGHCELGTPRALFIGTYLIIGVPIFAFTVAQFAEILVEKAIKANEQRLMTRPLTEEEFQFAYELHAGKINEAGSDESSLEEQAKQATALCEEKEIRLDLGDFIVLELLRLQKVTVYDLRNIKALFDMLDEDGDGVLINYPNHTTTDNDSITRQQQQDGTSPSIVQQDDIPTPLSSSNKTEYSDSQETMMPGGRYGSLSAIHEEESEQQQQQQQANMMIEEDIGGLLLPDEDLEAQMTKSPLITTTQSVDDSLWTAWSMPFSFPQVANNRGGPASVDEISTSNKKISDRYNQLIMQHLRHHSSHDHTQLLTQDDDTHKNSDSNNKLSTMSVDKTSSRQRSATEDTIPILHRTRSAQNNNNHHHSLLPLSNIQRRRHTVTGTTTGPNNLTENDLLLTNSTRGKQAVDSRDRNSQCYDV